jgi:hypothetical protein
MDEGGTMQRGRLVLGLIGGVVILVTSAAHSLLGWPQLRRALTTADTPADLIVALSIGWHFAGLAMLVFGVLAILLFADALRGRPVSLRPVVLIAIAYLVFGTWSLTVSSLDPFFLAFFVSGILLLMGAWSRPGAAPDGKPTMPSS